MPSSPFSQKKKPVKLIGRWRKLHIAIRRSTDTLDGSLKSSPFAPGCGIGYFSSNTGKEKGVRFCEFNVRTDIFGSFAICKAHCQICAFISKLSPTSITSNDVLGLYLSVGEMRNWYSHFIYNWHSYRGTTEKTQRRNFHSSVAMHFVRESLLALLLWDNGGGTGCFWCRKSLYLGLALPSPPSCALFVTPINVTTVGDLYFRCMIQQVLGTLSPGQTAGE